ncbi:3-hydroxy-3-methylglutaryl-coenzyme A reductase [Ruegeria halocynthiae]|uniref:hydroxymethylglutaryl-CoA reductase (NADPH) n=2 Tax=Ruegeria halocynthiae TaxID=985054 RepID=A0A1H2ZMX6_9RHOB|nr:3-hydroxy-3-methylglutaryl-coenzyme A reductase [Ruegeria halocynthiae]
MVIPFHVREMLQRIKARFDADQIPQQMAPNDAEFSTLRPSRRPTKEMVARFWDKLKPTASDEDQAQIADSATIEAAESYSANIENFIGTVKLPVGVIGPLRLNGMNANGDFHVPLATTEAALVASYARGAYVATRSGGISTAVLYEGVLRTPAFVFESLLKAGQFVDWVVTNVDILKSAAEATTRHGKLISLEPFIDTNVVFLICRYTTGDAAGQNMVTIATDALCHAITERCPVTIENWYIEGNFSGDKKASALGLVTGRGRKVSASVTLPADIVEKTLGTTVEAMLAYGRVANLGAHLSGQFGAQAHYANGLAAFYIATGQDAACVAESAMGVTRMEPRNGDLFCSVTLPNILVGSVGGGTGLPSQAAALNLLGLRGNGCGTALAEVAAATCLCGEISIVAAIAAGHFTRAHESLARQR